MGDARWGAVGGDLVVAVAGVQDPHGRGIMRGVGVDCVVVVAAAAVGNAAERDGVALAVVLVGYEGARDGSGGNEVGEAGRGRVELYHRKFLS